MLRVPSYVRKIQNKVGSNFSHLQHLLHLAAFCSIFFSISSQLATTRTYDTWVVSIYLCACLLHAARWCINDNDNDDDDALKVLVALSLHVFLLLGNYCFCS
ncbi:hypothetical protein F4810DRAFT_298882 [Camillea tinctor]|nr:hypothetical protein F4810DRAFT_298882 [Camillea tinctor]